MAEKCLNIAMNPHGKVKKCRKTAENRRIDCQSRREYDILFAALCLWVVRQREAGCGILHCEAAKEGKLWSQEEILVVRFKNYVKAGSLSEAYELNQKKSSIVAAV